MNIPPSTHMVGSKGLKVNVYPKVGGPHSDFVDRSTQISEKFCLLGTFRLGLRGA